MKKFQFLFFLMATVVIYSCRCSCQCNKNLGCKILIAKSSNGSVLATKMFCPSTDYYSNIALYDSVAVFRAQYQTGSTTVEERDSIYKYETVRNIKCPQGTDEFERNGYGCECAK